MSLQGDESIGIPWLPEEDMEEVLSLSTHLSHTTETSTLSRIKSERYIFTKKRVRLFIEAGKSMLWLWLYNNTTEMI